MSDEQKINLVRHRDALFERCRDRAYFDKFIDELARAQNPKPAAEGEQAWYIEASGDGQRDSRVVLGSKDQARRALADMMFFGTYEEAQKDGMVNAYLLEFDDEENNWANGVWEADGEQCWFRVSKIVEPVPIRATKPPAKAAARAQESQKVKTLELHIENLSALLRKCFYWAKTREPSVACGKIGDLSTKCQHLLTPVSALREFEKEGKA